MKNTVPLSIIIGSALLSQGAIADTVPTWKADAELGLLVTNGNTKTKNITAKAKVVNNRELWRHTLTAEALNSSENSSTTAERYFLSGKSDYKLTEKSYAFGLLSYENDRFSGYDYRISETLGYGRNIIQRDTLTLDLEAGLGSRQSKVSTTGGKENEGLVHLGGGLNWKLSGTSTFSENLSSDIGEKAAVTKSVTSLKTQIVGNLASNISYTAKYTSHVPAGFTKLDTEIAVTLVYSY